MGTTRELLPPRLENRHYCEYTLTDLSSSSMEYLTLKMNMMGHKTISRIVRVECPQLYGYFLLKKAEYQSRGRNVTVKELYHDTAEWKIDSILKTNLDWRMVARCKYGQGVSFSPSTSYANRQSSRSNGINRAMIVADVLVGAGHATSTGVRLPLNDYDTTVGNCGQVYVKFYDNEFYPKYIIYYIN
ncbi:poly [adp-ribose] polymerase [Holotrichia oblita]|uniref:Poly [adp-ribose] polymerase n=1 Tax=Holotrichia oblita TaxID=644536 RepID=A0ACB9SUU7_HOLOL|nr:poly [adp-ribose] polymerase [Holotrichia oblita]